MYRTGLLLLSHISSKSAVAQIINEACRQVREHIYVHFAPGLQLNPTKFRILNETNNLLNVVRHVYQITNLQGSVDIRCLLDEQIPSRPRQFRHVCEVILTDSEAANSKDYCNEWFGQSVHAAAPVVQLRAANPSSDCDIESSEVVRRVAANCLGGTFDQFHNGHRLLLAEAAFISNEKLVVGVSDEKLLERKILRELIQPLAERMAIVQEFLADTKPQVQSEIVPISDPFGPSIVYPWLDAITVSQETAEGANSINKKRVEKNMKELYIHTIELIPSGGDEPAKISSTDIRKQLLGSLLRAPTSRVTPSNGPYIVGLTGGTASGKSSICKHLENLGAGIVSCDQLGHLAYCKGTECYRKVVEAFGDDILAPDGEIHRPSLGAKVFADRSQLERLNQIVWPEIGRLAYEKTMALYEQGHKVVVHDAAVLLEAAWDKAVDEVWVAFISKDEAVRRIIARDKATEQQALARIEKQTSNEYKIQRANVVFCSFWEVEVTRKQVEKAWSLLQERIATL